MSSPPDRSDRTGPTTSTPAGPTATDPIDRVVTWAVRLGWLAVVVLAGPAFGSALAGLDRAARLTGTIGLWVGWAAVALALLVPSSVSLTAVRTLVPIGLVAAVVAAPAADGTIEVVAAIAPLAVVALLVATGEFGQHFVQASAYGDERRHLLRPPVAHLVPAVATWVVLCAAIIAGPLSLASGNWIAGIPLTAVAVALAVLLPPRFHRLTRRWLVLVPAGVVVHDHVVLAETAMFPTTQVASLHLAFADTEAADLTGPAAGNAVEIELRQMATVVLVPTRDTPNGRALHVQAMLVAPSRPGRVLRAAASRRLPVG